MKTEASSDEIIDKENDENVVANEIKQEIDDEINQKKSRQSSILSWAKKSPAAAKSTKNCSKRKRGKENIFS